MNKVQDEQDAKDLLQNVLLKSYQYCSRGKTVLYLKSWLYKIAANAIIDHYKATNKYQALIDDSIAEENNVSVTGEASVYIKTLLGLLPKEYAIPLAMYDLEDIPQKEIAQKLGLTLTNTKSRIQRGRMKLKELFLQCCAVIFDESGEMISFDIKPQCKELQAEKIRLQDIF